MGNLGFCFLLLLLNSIGIIGLMQWVKELVLSIKNKNQDSLWKCLLTLMLSILSGFIAWKVGFKEYDWYISIPLALGTLAITQLGYECIIKNLQVAIENVMHKIATLALEKNNEG